MDDALIVFEKSKLPDLTPRRPGIYKTFNTSAHLEKKFQEGLLVKQGKFQKCAYAIIRKEKSHACVPLMTVCQWQHAIKNRQNILEDFIEYKIRYALIYTLIKS